VRKGKGREREKEGKVRKGKDQEPQIFRPRTAPADRQTDAQTTQSVCSNRPRHSVLWVSEWRASLMHDAAAQRTRRAYLRNIGVSTVD